MNKKGQAAMEFLMTYGWAILVVLAAIGALAYFGVLSPKNMLPDTYTLSDNFGAGQAKVSVGKVEFDFTNGLGTSVNITSVTVERTDGTSNCSITNVGTIANGAKTSSLLNCSLTTGALGDKFSGNIKIKYIKSGETVEHTATGSLTASVEE